MTFSAIHRSLTVLALATISAPMAAAISQELPEWQQERHARVPPSWDDKFDKRELGLTLTQQERDLIVRAMDAQPEINTSQFYKNARDYLANGGAMTMGIFVFVNRPLMLMQATEDGVAARALLKRLRPLVSANALKPPPEQK